MLPKDEVRFYKRLKEVEDDFYIGMRFDNYKVLCDYLDLDYRKGGNSKRAQIASLNQYISTHKEGNAYIVDSFDFSEFNPFNTNEVDTYSKLEMNGCEIEGACIYEILSDGEIYVGSTNNLKRRYFQHKQMDTSMKHMMAKTDAIMRVLYVYDNNDFDLMRLCESEVINMYKQHGYNVVNDRSGWGINKNKQMYNIIRVHKSDYDKAMKLLTDNNIKIRTK